MERVKKSFYIAIIGTLIAAGLGGCAGTISTAPPPPLVETIPVPPSPRHVWVPGYYQPRGRDYVWVRGSYRVAPAGRGWVGARYEQRGKGYVFRKGHWN